METKLTSVRLKDWVPQEPWQGPPLPDFLNIYWPWYKAPAADFKVSNMVITPTEASTGQIVDISAKVTNVGALSGDYTVHLGGDFSAETTVSLEPAETQDILFQVTPETEKTYYVTLDGLSGSFKATGAPVAEIRAENLVITPTECYVGEKVNIGATVTNYGSTAGSKTIKCQVNSMTSEQSVTLNTNESIDVLFEVIPKEVKTYQVQLNGLSGSFKVTSPTVGNFVYSGEHLEMRYYTEINPYAGTGTIYAVYGCNIKNDSPESGVRSISLSYYYYSPYYDRYTDPKLVKSFKLTLNAGQSYDFVFDPRVNSGDLWLGGRATNPAHRVTFYFYLSDNAGGESEKASAQ